LAYAEEFEEAGNDWPNRPEDWRRNMNKALIPVLKMQPTA
jgi:hypothetical protein